MNNNFQKTILSIFHILTGLALGLLLNELKYISLKGEVSVGEISNFAISAIIALLIPFYLNKEINNKITEKSIINDGFDRLMKEIEELKKIIDEEYNNQKIIEQNRATLILTKVTVISNMLKIAIEEVGEYSKIEEIAKVIKRMEREQIIFWRELTLSLRDKDNKITPNIHKKTEKNFLSYISNISKLKKMIVCS